VPTVVVIAGPNGAGKSTTAPPIVRDVFGITEFVNADAIAQGLSAFAPERAARQAGRLMINRIRSLANQRRDFAFETTLASRTFQPWLAAQKVRGYQFHLVYLWLANADVAVMRVGQRVRSGGHGIPESDVRRRYERSVGNFFNLYRPLADSWLMLDNSSQQPVSIAWRDPGGPVRINPRGPWNKLRARYEEDSGR
jgi:predicted ABC-type ATPase